MAIPSKYSACPTFREKRRGNLLATFGRLVSAGFDGNSFVYSYLANSNLLASMTTAGGMAKKVFTYETNRDLPTEIAFKLTNNTLIAKRNYTFDALGRVSARTQTRGSSAARNDVFGYNDRSELTSATLGTDDYAYNFDNIGNRITAAELADEIAYEANNLNRYTAIEKNSGTPFVPTFDDDGNQLTVQTATGVWSVGYNAENRPVTFTQGTTVIECKYDSQGRRFEKKVTANGTVTFWQRYAYRGYLQIAAFNVSIVDEAEVLSLATTTYWDPMEQTATRPLAFTDHTAATPATYFYTHDLTKNVCELLNASGAIVTTYDYTPFGAVTASNSATPNTFMFSSEVYDPETALVYYNYRHYNPLDGRWINRDPIGEVKFINLYCVLDNTLANGFDVLGLAGNVTHGTYACHKNDSCPLLAEKAIQWIRHYAERQRELMIDKNNLKKTDPTSYNNHIDVAKRSGNNALTCITILIEKIRKCECEGRNPKVPKFVPKTLPEPIYVPQKVEKPWYNRINWEYVGYTVLFATATGALLLIPVDGPIGEAAAGDMTVKFASGIL